MRFFREVKLQYILVLNLILGFLSGRFLLQAIRLVLGCNSFDGIFWRILGVQYGMLIFIIVFFINQYLWKKKREYLKKTGEDTVKLYFRLGLTVAVYAVGAVLINLLFLLVR